MQCPQDRSPLVGHRHGDTDVQSCKRCSGLWIPPRVVAAALGHVPQRPRGSTAKPHATRRCPEDRSALYAVHAHGVEVDVCGQCGGVWLDDGELQRIAELRGATQDSTGQSGGAAIDAAGTAVDVASGAADVVGGALEFVVEALFSW